MLAQDAADGPGRAIQAGLLLQPPGAKAGDAVPRRQDRLLDLGRGFMGDAVRGPRALVQARFALLLVAAQPLAHGVPGALEDAAGGTNALLQRRLDHPVAER
ncbi:MAG: hypothetical protein NNA24_13050 [Nitrospira sp.]|nr:hypothetical protein [Nitrospira sp.]